MPALRRLSDVSLVRGRRGEGYDSDRRSLAAVSCFTTLGINLICPYTSQRAQLMMHRSRDGGRGMGGEREREGKTEIGEDKREKEKMRGRKRGGKWEMAALTE